jgi:RNA polymerase sigma-70 factor (ECF subfamily)
MTRRRREAPPFAEHPAVFVDTKDLVAQMPDVRRFLRFLRVRGSEVPDVAQDVLLGAFRSMKAGRFRPFPGLPVAESLRRWMFGIAWRLASRHRDRAHVRRERSAGLLLVLRFDPVGPEEQLDARRALRLLVQVGEPYRGAMLERADGAKHREIAEEQGVPVPTASKRILVGRKQFRSAIRASQRPKRWRRRRR